MDKPKRKIPLSGLESLEKSFAPKTTENKTEPSKVEIKAAVDKKVIIKPPLEVSNSSDEEVETQNLSSTKKKFTSFFNKNYKVDDAELMNVDKDIKNILEKLANFSKDTTQVSLVSNILKAWIEEHKPDIQKIFRENTKIDF